jgi:outer membrane protein TolC
MGANRDGRPQGPPERAGASPAPTNAGAGGFVGAPLAWHAEAAEQRRRAAARWGGAGPRPARSRLAVGCLVLAFVLTIWATPTHAQPPAIPATVDLPPRVGVDAGPPRPLTLDEAIRLTLEGNNDVTIARLELRASREGLRAAEGIFDPRLFPSLSYQRATTPSASAIGGAVNGRVQQNQVFAGLGLDGRSPWAGGRYSLDFTSTRVRTSNQFARLNPQYPTAVGARVTQPLFRGRTFDQERRQIEIARRATDLTDAQLAQVVTEQLTLVEEAYWNLVFTVRNLEVQAQALAQAQAQVTSNERQAQEGTLAPIDVVEAQTQVANFRQNVASAQQTLTEAENRLKNLMLARRDAELWNRALVPAEAADRPAPQVSLEEAVAAAMQRRPELRALETALAQNAIDQRFFRDQAKPQVDLVGAYTLQGLAGAPLVASAPPVGGTTDAAILARLNELSLQAGLVPLDVPPPPTGATVPDFFRGAYGQSLANLFERRFPTALVQLQVELPFGNRTARANVARAEIAAEQIARQRQRLEQVIEVEVRNALQAVRSSQERLDAAASAQRNASEQYESERRRFEAGLSTVFLVLERQTALVNAQARELRARADLNQAIAVLDRAVGGTLERHGVAVAEAR